MSLSVSVETKSKGGTWQGKTDGSPFMLRALIGMMRVLPLWVFYGVMVLSLPFYMIFRPKACGYIYRFYRRAVGKNWLVSAWLLCRNYYTFGLCVLDRFAAFAGTKFKCKVIGGERFTEMTEQAEGFISLSAHVGNYEIAGMVMQSDKKRIRALVYGGESEVIMQYREKVLKEHGMGMIVVKDDMGHLYEMNAALQSGEVISMPADRRYGEQKSLEVPFLNTRIKFPMGAYLTAVAYKVELMAVFCMRRGYKQYDVMAYPLPMPKEGGSKAEKAEALCREYVKVLEDTVRQYPEQWFNYYDIWKA